MAKQEEHFETPAKRGTAIKQGAKNKEPEMTMEEYLLSQLDTPVVLKDGTMMTKPDGFDSKIKHIEKGEDWSEDKRVWWYTSEHAPKRMNLCFYHNDYEGYTLCTDEEKKQILKGLKFGRQCFEKRLDAYLKRYGTKKLHTWTYWADA